MRLVTCLAAVCGLCVLAGCGSSGSSTTQTANGPTLIRVPTTTTTTSTRPRKQAPIPPVPAAASACSGLTRLGAGVAGATQLRAELGGVISALSSFVATKPSGNAAQSEQLRVRSVLSSMHAAASAADRYVASPTSSNRQALVAAAQAEAATARANTLPACAIRAS